MTEKGCRPGCRCDHIFLDYCVLVMVLQGWPWNDCEGTEKELLHCKFDILKTEVQHSTAALDHRIEKILQQIRVTGRARK